VVPDILLPDPAGHVEAGERQLEHAIAWSQVAPAPHTNWATTWKTPSLVQHSTARVIKNPLLAKIAATTALLKARQNDTRIPLARPAWEARRTEQRIALEAASPDLKKAPANFVVKVIEEPTTKAVSPPPPGVKPDDRLSKWSDNLARDPWVDETLNILGDMK
ncbi:MAG: carboxy terminal-processing peptidase, partial [Deltaproteobacteria bacterium]|nr:carboxy terminal-processing peptidase [Deltaproteobacteria bacterium]